MTKTIVEEFKEWWANYPRREAKLNAVRAYEKARKMAGAEEILAGLARWKQHMPENRKFVPLPASWLNAGSWMNEYEDDDGGEPANVHHVLEFLDWFGDEYRRRRHGATYMSRRDRDILLLAALLLAYPYDRLQKLATILLTTDDEWVSTTDRGIGILHAKATWLDNLLCQFEAKRTA